MVGVDILLLILDGVSRKKGMSTNHRALGYTTIIVWFFGFALKLTGIILYKSFADFVIPFLIITAARFIFMFLCIPHTFNNYPRY